MTIWYARVKNISGQLTGIFEAKADGSEPDVELKSESLHLFKTWQFSLQRKPNKLQCIGWDDHEAVIEANGLGKAEKHGNDQIHSRAPAGLQNPQTGAGTRPRG